MWIEAVMGIYPWFPTGSEQSAQYGLWVVYYGNIPMVTHGE